MFTSKQKVPDYTPPEIEPGDINSYITNRLDDQINWYDKKSQNAQKRYKCLQLTELVIAAAIPLLSSYTVGCSQVAFMVGVLGAAIAIIEGIERLYRYHENWIEYRAACEALKHEKSLYLMNAFPYGTDETKEQLFVHNIENLLSFEGSKWKSSNAKPVTDKSKTQSGTAS